MKNNQKISFAFVDEVGCSFDAAQPLFGVGVLLIKDTLELNEKLHHILCEATSRFKKPKSTFEFKFKYIKKSNADIYKKIIAVLEKNEDWKFVCLFDEKKTKRKIGEKDYIWKKYIKLLRTLFKISNKNIIIIADYFSKPGFAKQDLYSIRKLKNVKNILQLESQGTLLLQVADILLGGLNLIERKKYMPEGFNYHEKKEMIAGIIRKMLLAKKMIKEKQKKRL